MAAAPFSPSPAAVVRGWLSDAGRLPDRDFTSWTCVVADTTIRLRCTDNATGAAYRSRMTGGAGAGRAPGLWFDLVETERVGWPPPGASEIWRRSPDWIERRLTSEGLAALMPERRAGDEGYPWVFFDSATGRGLVLVRTVADLPPWTEGAPFSLLFHLACAWRGWRLLHAGTLGLDGRGMLLAGPGGAGKSATTLAGLQAGLKTVGDDYVVLQPDPAPTAWPLYRVVKQSPAGLARLPAPLDSLAGRETNWHGKVEFDPEAIFPGSLARSLELGAIVLPKVTDAAITKIAPVSPTRAFSALAGSMFPQLPGGRLAGFSVLTRLTRSLPAFEARLSPDAAEVGQALLQFMTRGPA